MEVNNFVNTVQELGFKLAGQSFVNAFINFRIAELVIQQPLRTDVGSHNHNSVAEIDRASLTISQTTIIHNLEQNVEDIWVSLFNFIEKHHRIRTSAHRFSKLAALVVTDISRRSTDHSSYSMFLLIL